MKNKVLINFNSIDETDKHVYLFEEEPSLMSIVRLMKQISNKVKEMPYYFVLLEKEEAFQPEIHQVYYINAKVVDTAIIDDNRFKKMAQDNNCQKIVFLERDGIIKQAYPYKKIDKTITIA